jgi:hypothetical protein
VEAGVIAILSATTAAIAATGIVGMTGTVAASVMEEPVPNGCNRAAPEIFQTRKKPSDSGGFFVRRGRGKPQHFAGQGGFALLNDAVQA